MKLFYRFLCLIISFFCAHSLSAQMRQLSKDATNPMNEIQELSFYSPSEGYIAYDRYIGFTDDSGRTIIRKPISVSNVNYNNFNNVNLTFGFGIKGVTAFSRDTLIVYGDYGVVPSILYSIDGGATFTLVYHSRYDGFAFKTGFTSMVFPQDHTTGYAVEADRIVKTTDKGRSWFIVRQDVDRYFDHVFAIDNDHVFAVSTKYNAAKLLKSNNGGATWLDITLPAGQLIAAHFLTLSNGWVIMNNNDQNGVVYVTTNGGASWQQQNDPQVTPFKSQLFKFVNDTTGYALGELFTVYKTTDAGRIWQPLPRDNNFTHEYYAHNDLRIWNENQLWAGGGHGFIEINTNASGNPLPRAFFKTDTNGVAATGIVNLRNYSKSFYQFKWLRNDTLISTAYHTSFIHDQYKFRDTIKLVVFDGVHSDTLVNYIDYPKVWITSFTPASAQRGKTVTINGYNFTGTFDVRFGGVQASSFSVVSNTQIKAVVGSGASGNVEVFTTQGSAAMPGFVFLGNPILDLPTAISDSFLCKAEPVTITIQNTEQDVIYTLANFSSSTVMGSVIGNGGTVSFVTLPISQSGEYRIRTNRPGDFASFYFHSGFKIRVEHPQARFVFDQVNITPGEPVMYAAQAGEIRDYFWTFNEDASTAAATGKKVAGITYAIGGQKTVQLIGVAEFGCRDTITANGTFVYTGLPANDNCVIHPLDATGVTGMAVGKVMNGIDDATYVMGNTAGARQLRSMPGASKAFEPGDHHFIAKYNAGNVLKWAHYFKPGTGVFRDGEIDAAGNIYLTGYAFSTQFLYLNNGDSMQLYGVPADTTHFGERIHGFILKLDGNGKYLWHTILYDGIVLWQGFGAEAIGEQIAVKDDHITVVGACYGQLAYARNGVVAPLYSNLPWDRQGQKNHVVLKIRPDGSLVWNARLQFDAVNWHRITDLGIDKAGNTYLAGTYEQSVKLYDAAGMEKAVLRGRLPGHNAFMIKYNTTGAIQWYNNFVPDYDYQDAGLTKLVADDEGNTYVGGEMFSSSQPASISITHRDGTMVKDTLAAYALYKFDTDGKRRWAVGSRYPNYGSAGAVYVQGSEVFAAGRIYSYDPEFSSYTLTSSNGIHKTVGIARGECFIAKYDTSGVLKQVNTSGYHDGALQITPASFYINSKGQVVLGGNAARLPGGDLHHVFGARWPVQFEGSVDGFFLKSVPEFCKLPLTANAGPDRVRCAGDTASIGSKASGNFYSWTSSPAGFTSDQPTAVVRPLVNTLYTLAVSNEKGETVYDTVAVTTRPRPLVDAGRDTAICPGQSAPIGTPAVAGNSYNWYVLPYNSVLGVNKAQMNIFPQITSSYLLRATDAGGCSSDDTVTVSILFGGTPGVRLIASQHTICEGDPVLFTAIPYNVGPDISYHWKINGLPIQNNSDRITIDTLETTDEVTVDVVHNNTCYSPPTVNGITVRTLVIRKLNPSVVVSGNALVEAGAVTTVLANITDAGDSYFLKWQDSTSMHGWQDLPSQVNMGRYEYRPAASGDKIRCVLSLNATCVTSQVVNSAGFGFVVNKVTAIVPVPGADYGFRFYPNPAQSVLIIDSMRVTDRWRQLQIMGIDGRQTFLQMDISNRTSVAVAVEGLRPGVYIAMLRDARGQVVYFRFIKG